MKKMTLATKILCLAFVALMVATTWVVPASAGSAYQTYVYDIYGDPLYSPDAYTAIKSVNSDDMGLEVPIETPGDMITDLDKNVYIADTGNNRIVVLDRYYKVKFTISNFSNDQGVPDSLAGPQGVFVSEANDKYDKLIWVCDTGSNRIVVFDEFGNFFKIIEEPESSLFDTDSVYKPVAMAVDAYNRLYVVSSTTYQGIIVMTDEGVFTGFIGAQKVAISAWDIIWRRFQTEEQRAQQEQLVS
ncbi:MAG: hypothetical protein E7645_02835, partial [Ruminococcaceae bacterium]|nr:hypothetical protein [Oscillospiraceae bacterium]